MNHSWPVLRFAALVLLVLPPLCAQNISGTVLGTIRDASGHLVAGADVTVTNTETNVAARAATNESGYYEFPYLKPGPYSLRVRQEGFKTVERTRFNLAVDDRTRLDITLEVGDVTTSISVDDKMAPVQSESASLGQSISSNMAREIPLAGRNVFELASLAAGVILNPSADGRYVAEGGFDSSDISIGGGRYRTNEFLIDGVTVMLPQNNNHAITPTPEATQEVKVMTGNNGSQFGRTGGGTINVATKGGTNEFHGNGWEYFRNQLFQANDFFSNTRGQQRGEFQFQMIGGTFGGPIRRNRTFFFAEYQASRNHVNGGGGVNTFPTEEQRRGDFSTTLTSDNRAITIYDPATTQLSADGRTFTRAPFAGNRIPAARIDRVAARLTQFIPVPNRPGEGPAKLFNWGFNNQNDVNSDQGSLRLDHRFSEKHSIFGRGTRTVTRIVSPALFGTIADTGGDDQVQAYVNAVINGTYILSPHRLVNYRYGLTRKVQNTHPTYLNDIRLADLGFPDTVAKNAQLQIFPQISMSGYTDIGTAPPRRVSNDIHAWVADATEIHGRHTIKYGVDVRVYNQNPFNASAAAGAYSFANTFTQGPDPLRATRGSGDGFASFLTGYGTGMIQYSPAFRIRNAYYGLFASDDIRLGKLTVNLGLRWEYEQPRTEKYDRFANFDFNREFPVKPLFGATPKGVLTQAGRENSPRGQFDVASRNFGPSIGIAYRVRTNMAIRAAYGIVYSPRIGYPNSRNFGASGEELTTQWVSSLDGATPLYPFSNPYPAGIFIRSDKEADRRLMGQTLTVTARNSRNNTYMQQWNFTIQRSLPGNWTIETAYVGTRGIRLPLAVQFDQLHPMYQKFGTDLNRLIANPFAGQVSTGPLAAATVTQGQLLRPFPQYLNVSTFIQTAGYSQYHGMNLTAEKRFSRGLTLLLAYTTSKTIDSGAGRVIDITGLQPPIQNQYDLRSEKSLSQQDVSQRLAMAHSWEVPVGRGRSFLSNASRPVDFMIGGWSLSGQATFQIGFPLGLTSIGNSGVFSAVQRPNNVGRSATLSGDVQDRLGRYFDTSAFTVPDTFTFGNTGRALPDTRGPGRRNYNFALSKKFPITERFSALFRGEAYNLTNTPNFIFPGLWGRSPDLQGGLQTASAGSDRKPDSAARQPVASHEATRDLEIPRQVWRPGPTEQRKSSQSSAWLETVLVAALLASPVFAQPAIDVGAQRQLFLDDRFVREAKGVQFVVHQPRKTGELSIPNEEGWPLGGYASVLFDSGTYHVYYTARDAICYARSRDGIHWERPALHLAKIDGNTRNNVVLGYGAGGVKEGTHGVMVFIDPKAPPSERFRLVANPEEFRRMLQVFSSPDGIHWKHTHRDVMVFDDSKKPHHLDTLNSIFFDDRLGKYVAYVRRNNRIPGEPAPQGRMVARAESADLAKFGHIDQTQYVFGSDAVNIRHYDPLRKAETTLIDIYTNGAVKYPYAQDAYFLFPAVYYHYGAHLTEFRKELPINAGVLDGRFAASRDGIEWNRYDWRPFIPTGMQGEFDSRRVYPAYGIVPSLNGRELYLYYLGTNDTHGWDRDDKNNRLLTAAGVKPQPLERAISRVVLRRDGFVSIRAGHAGGEFVTPPMTFTGEQLVLNADTSALGEIQIEVQDKQGKPVPGFALADADIIHSTNEISRPVSWNGMSSLAKLASQTIRLRFVLRDTDIYAFQFRDRPSI
ncbi:MAG: carboxypeptidase regulatory-like domain-containing protein [Candidatus Solibacter usitatus]|nr:carboxypeptidase regulatory-like domain-containing protein [Candidatus Solibacter usitatus]